MTNRTDRRSLRHGAILALAVSALALSACGDSTKRALGLSRTPPDEFQVVTRAPLTQPPDLNLRPPRPGADSPAAVTTREQARQAVFRAEDTGRPAPGSRAANSLAPDAAPREPVTRLTPGESAFLADANALEADPLIRVTVDRETAVLTEANQNFVRELLGLKQDPVDEVVDAEAEARRLRENQALGRPASEGDTPVIERKSNSILSIF